MISYQDLALLADMTSLSIHTMQSLVISLIDIYTMSETSH